MTRTVLDARSLNRALLARQLLLERSSLDPISAMEQVGGLQTQYAPSGYIGLWSRLCDFERPMLTLALEERRAVQGTMMRATIHTVSAADYWPMTAGVRRTRREWSATATRRALGEVDMVAVAAAVRDELAGGPLPMRELAARITSRGFPAQAASFAGMWIDLVRIPPSGTWDRRRADVYGLADAWLEPVEVSEDEGIAHLARRYLGAFGPAPLRDIAGWMGVAIGRIRHVVEQLDLRTLSDEAGRPLVDLPDAPLPDPETPAPVRFLPVWDATLLAHARRTQILPEEYRPLIFNTKSPQSINTFLIDGRVAGTWRFENGEIQLSPLRQITRAERAALEEEAHQLAAMHA